MGYELQAKVVPPIEPTELQNALKDRFVSLQWEIVRPNGNRFSVAAAGRVGNSWDEDYVIGVGRTINMAVNRDGFGAELLTEKPTETVIYLLDHNGSDLKISEITRLIDDVINCFGASAVWEEL